MEIKITANFMLPGSVMFRENVCQSDKSKYVDNHMRVFNSETKKLETIKYKTRGYEPAVQYINMSNEAYDGMMESPVEGYSIKVWRKMTPAARVIEHLKLIQADLQAISFDFTIYDD